MAMDDTRGQLDFCCRFLVDGSVVSVAPEFGGRVAVGANLFDAIVACDRERLLQAVTSTDALGTPFDVRLRDPRGHLRVFTVEVEPGDDPATEDLDDQLPAIPGSMPPAATYSLHGRDVTDVRRVGAVLHAHREVLDQIATGAPIATGLDAVARLFEVVAPESSVAIYLRRDDTLELAAAPSAPSAYSGALGRVAHEPGVPVAGTIEPVTGDLAAVIDERGFGFGWWRSVLDEDGDDIGRIVLLAPIKRFLTADERLLLDEAARLVSVAAGTARSARRALDAGARDSLTGLLHRRAALRALVPATGTGPEHRERSGLVLALVRVGGVSAANATYGYEAGDAMLRATAERLRRIVRSRDLLARWSGTHFLVVGHDRGGPDALDGFARRVAGAAEAKVVLGGRTLDPEVSVVVDRQLPGESPVDALVRFETTQIGKGDAPRRGRALPPATRTTGSGARRGGR